jgi:hypothetical protein
VSAYSVGTSTYRRDNLVIATDGLVARLGLDTGQKAVAQKAVESAEDDFKDEKLASLIKWIPGDVIAAYGLLIAAFAGSQSQPQDWIVGVGIIMALVLVFTGAYQESKRGGTSFEPWKVAWRAAVAALAFLIWSFAVPDSPSRAWDIVADVPAAGLAALVAVAASIFTAVADAIFD